MQIPHCIFEINAVSKSSIMAFIQGQGQAKVKNFASMPLFQTTYAPAMPFMQALAVPSYPLVHIHLVQDAAAHF